ncbi:hypothetical protein COCVIDRAFT_100471 [Bipolaris victoriae FI3]|uniref:Uncharacterized protein n=1 Tax=Bipolaris victoriae (strain FI3) TaxID=930091 RepID=W7ERK9_BIPV3|nr:hypothetical protein COCVIDRAFT_100471 [Bipolaris victoriae FI3]
MPDAQAPDSPQAQPESKTVRLHITPFRPDLLKVYLAPSVLPLAQNISYHTVETFPEKGFGYLELPEVEAQKIKKKLNGTILKGSKVRIEMAKPEKRKAREEAEAAKEAQGEADRPSKRAKKDKKEKKERKKKEQGVLEGVELPDDRKVKRGWTEPVTKTKKDKKEKKDKKDKSDKEAKKERKHSKYTKEPELLFKAKLTPVAATEVALKDKKKDKKEKKEKNKSKSTEVVVHEFEKNTKTPSFLKQPDVVISKKPAVDYVNGLGWVDEDGVVVEPETGKAKARRALELVDAPSEAAKAWIDGTSKSSSTPKVTKEQKKKKKVTPPQSSSESESEESSVVSSSSEDEDSSDSDSEESAEESEAEESEAASPAPSAVKSKKAPEKSQPTAPAEKEVHPLEALFKRSKPTDNSITTPTKKLNPIDTSFTFFDNNADVDTSEATGQPIEDAPITPYTQRDIEWRGLRSAAPTPDTAAIGRRFSFDWRRNSQERDDDEDDSDLDVHAEHQLSLNTRTNASKLADVTEEDEGITADGENGEAAKPESEFKKWFWENRGDLNRAWKKQRRDALKAKRLGENRKMTRRIV